MRRTPSYKSIHDMLLALRGKRQVISFTIFAHELKQILEEDTPNRTERILDYIQAYGGGQEIPEEVVRVIQRNPLV